MTGAPLLALGISVAIFLAAATLLKVHVNGGGWPALAGALLLYGAGNWLITIPMRAGGLALAMSLSAMVQIVAVNVIAALFFREAMPPARVAGLALAVVAIWLIGRTPRATL